MKAGQPQRSLFKTWRYRLEGAFAVCLYRFFGWLSVETASAVAAFLARQIGPRLSVHRQAKKRLRRAFPLFNEKAAETVLIGMWDNLARVMAEYPHLAQISEEGRITVVGAEHVRTLRDDGRPGLFFSGHYGNWEVASLGTALAGLPIALVYRSANNPVVEKLFQKARTQNATQQLPKGPEAARQLVALLRRGGHIGMLVDQKMNDGIPVPFFGQSAMTAPALARLSQKFQCPVVPVRVERLPSVRFRVTIHPPLLPPDPEKGEAAVRVMMEEVNAILEGWIIDRPDHWFWLHRRWPEKTE